MSWIQEIIRSLLLVMGVFEVISNSMFLAKSDGLSLARKQHQELPKNISDTKIKVKVIIMLVFGIAFLLVSASSYVLHRYLHDVFLSVLILFAIYGVSEAIFYRFWRTWGFAVVTLLLLSASIIA